MNLNEKKFFSTLNSLNCIEDKPSIAVGVSGGPDSMALVYLLSRWIKQKKGKLYGLIFDHGIRKNSKEESYKVKNMLKNINIQVFIIKVKKNKSLKKNMSQARENRFEGLISFCNKNNILHLFLGHHYDDNLETYLIRKINGSNLEGLGAMSDITYFNKIQILRPLIKINKSSILNFNKKNKIMFLNDPSNQNINFTRVKVRNFLQNKNYQIMVKNDFSNIKNQIPYYKKMIWELFISSLSDVNSNSIKISFKKLINFDDLVIEKHISMILKFLSNKKHQTKTSKIYLFIDLLKKPNFKIFNLSGINIQKKSDFLIFSQK